MDQKVNDDEIDLRALIAVLLNHWKLILSMLLLGLLGGITMPSRLRQSIKATR